MLKCIADKTWYYCCWCRCFCAFVHNQHDNNHLNCDVV